MALAIDAKPDNAGSFPGLTVNGNVGSSAEQAWCAWTSRSNILVKRPGFSGERVLSWGRLALGVLAAAW